MKFIDKYIIPFIFVIGIICIGIYLFVSDNETYAYSEDLYKDESLSLNPEWVEYQGLSLEEQVQYEVVPEKYLTRYVGNSYVKENSGFPTYYNLADEGYSNNIKDQSNSGLCWAFSVTNVLESSILVQNASDKIVTFSERQLDYGTASSIYFKEKYNPYNKVRGLQDGVSYEEMFDLVKVGVSPVDEDVFGKLNYVNDVKSVKDVFSLNNVEYSVDDYINYGSINKLSTATEKDSWVKAIKYHILNYGSVSVATIGPYPSYAGSCVYHDSNGNYMLNVLDNCNASIIANGHAMAIIGWDDDYKYSYCKRDTYTDSNLTNCYNIISGKGAFILQNSWGDVITYPYLAYGSYVNASYGVRGVTKKNWDNNYDKTKVYKIENQNKNLLVSYYKSSVIKEKLEKISFNVNTVGNYSVYVSTDNGKSFIELGDVVTNKKGRYSLNIDRELILDNNSFIVKVYYGNGNINDIYAFTSYVDDTSEFIADTVMKNEEVINDFTSELSVYTITKNIDVGEYINYKLFDKDNNDISNLIKISDNMIFNNVVKPTITFNDVIVYDKMYLRTIYNGEVLDELEIRINKSERPWEGYGTLNNPYLIYSVDDLLKLKTNKEYFDASFKVMNDLNFEGLNWDVYERMGFNEFTGTFDGNNHIFYNLNSEDSLFYSIREAIVKNIVFANSSITGSNWLNILAFRSYDSYFENIILMASVNFDGSGEYVGGIVGSDTGSTFYRIANYANVKSSGDKSSTVNSSSDTASSVGGIVSSCNGCKIVQSYNYGNISSNYDYVGGIAGSLLKDTINDNMAEIVDCYNFGNVISTYYAGGLVGNLLESNINSSYSISNFDYVSSDKENIVYGHLVGNAIGGYIKNSYYLKNNEQVIANNLNTVLEQVEGYEIDKLKNKSVYQGFDFDDIWSIDNGYPYLKNIEVRYIEKIEGEEEITIRIDEKANLRVNIMPSNAMVKMLEYKIDDKRIAKLDNNFNIVGLKLGSTLLSIRTIDGSKVEKVIKINVIDNNYIEEYDIVKDKYINLKEFMAKDTFIDKLDNKNYRFEVNTTRKVLATGDKLFVKSGDNIRKEYIVSILGDVAGNGEVNIGDVAKAYQYFKKRLIIDEECVMAADVVMDNEIRINDVAKLYQYYKKRIPSLEG